MSMAWLIISKIRKFFQFQHSKQLLLTTVLLFAIVFSVIRLLWAASPDPGHLLSSIGDGYFVTAGPTTPRTFTFPDASATVLTTNALVSAAQGGTGTSSLTGVLLGNGTSAVTATTSPGGLLVGTTETQTLTGKTINASDNTITCDGIQAGYLLYSNSSKFVCLARGQAGQFLRTNAAGTNVEYASISSSPAGSDTQLQYNSSGSFGASSSLSWTDSSKSLNLSGYLNVSSSTFPSVATTGTIKLFNNKIVGRDMLSVRTDEPSDYYAVQPSWYQNSVFIIGTGTATTPTSIGMSMSNSLGCGATHTNAQDTGYVMSTRACTLNGTGYVGATNALFYRGSINGRNGYFFFARVGLNSSGATNIGAWVGLSDQAMTTALGSDNPVGSRSGFAFVDSLGETNWMFSNRAGATEDRNSTGMALAASKMYDLYFYTPPRGDVVSWRVDNLTDSTTAEGSSVTSLPTSTVAMRAGAGVRSLNGDNILMYVQKIYVEVPR